MYPQPYSIYSLRGTVNPRASGLQELLKIQAFIALSFLKREVVKGLGSELLKGGGV